MCQGPKCTVIKLWMSSKCTQISEYNSAKDTHELGLATSRCWKGSYGSLECSNAPFSVKTVLKLWSINSSIPVYTSCDTIWHFSCNDLLRDKNPFKCRDLARARFKLNHFTPFYITKHLSPLSRSQYICLEIDIFYTLGANIFPTISFLTASWYHVTQES